MVGYPIYFTIWDVGLGNTSSPRLAMLCLLRAKLKDFVAHFGLKCSSLCQMNCGTSMRAPCCSLGFDKYPSVFLSNVLSDRTRARNMSDNSLHLGCYRFGFCSPVIFLDSMDINPLVSIFRKAVNNIVFLGMCW